MSSFGEKLRHLRKQQGLTIRQMGKIFEVDFSYIGRLERGENIPSVPTALKISRYFDVSLDILLKDELDLED